MKKIKTFFMIVVIIIFAVLAYFITKRIMFNRIEEKFWAAITEAERNGNYHIITRQRTSSEEDYHKVEAICKNGRYYIYRKYNTSDNVGTGYLMLSPGEVYYIKEDKDIKRATHTSFITYGYKHIKLHFFELPRDYYDVTKIENGKYDGKDCYIITMEHYAGSENGTEEVFVYLNKKTYLPYNVEGEVPAGSVLVDADGESKPEMIYDLIEFDDDVDVEFPEINLDEYEIIERENI